MKFEPPPAPRLGLSRSGFDVVTLLILANVLVYLFQDHLLREGRLHAFIDRYALSFRGLREGRLWQLFTHQFLHGGDFPVIMRLLHLTLNMAVVYSVGKELLGYLSNARFLALYLLSGIAGGLLQIAVTPADPLLGASGAAFGLMMAYTTIHAHELIDVLILGYPKRMNATTLGYALLFSNLLLGLVSLLSRRHIPFISDVGHFAHLGGCLMGVAFMWFSGFRKRPLTREELLRLRKNHEARMATRSSDLS